MPSLYSGEHATLKSELDDGVLLYILQMIAGENRFTIKMNEELHKALSIIQSDLLLYPPSTRVAFILTGSDKYFSLGLDLKSYYESSTPQELFQKSYQTVIKRILGLGMITVAAINGHVIAGGMVAALACDYRVMNLERGFMAMNEIQLPSSIPAGMLSVIQQKIADPQLQRDILLLGKRYTGKEMHSKGIIDKMVEGEKVMEESKRLAIQLAHPIKKIPFVELIKGIQYRAPLKMLSDLEPIDHFLHAVSVSKL
jgi:enoyl-CoA hydratase/carnithine racemase